MLLIPLGACFARNPIYAPAELASVERGSSPAITPNCYLATIAACPHGAVIPLIIALRRQAPQWRKRLLDFFYLVMIIVRWGRAPSWRKSPHSAPPEPHAPANSSASSSEFISEKQHSQRLPRATCHQYCCSCDFAGPIPVRRMPAVLMLLCLTMGVWAGSIDVGYAQDPAAVMLATFDVDVTPPLGNHMAYDPVKRVDELTLRSRGVILTGSGSPIVLCAVDFLGIANEAHDEWREAIAAAAGTTSDRVAVHTLHQHDAPHVDYTAEQLLRDVNAPQLGPFDGAFARQAMHNTAAAVKAAMQKLQPVTHVGFGSAEVIDVASNRRILGDDGKVRVTRFTATRDAVVRAEPVGTIDPMVNVVSFWNADVPIAVLSYYAVHPQSYYRMAIPSPDFPGIARFIRQQAVPFAVHVHFNGAGGNLGAGKYNDGSHENRVVLATRLADGMKRAFDATEKSELTPAQVAWTAVKVSLPMTERFDETRFRADLQASATNRPASTQAAQKLAWLMRQQSRHQIDIPMLSLGDIRLVHMPGELFVEYQLAAKAMRPELKVAMAAYGDYGPCYIGTAIAYEQGGYETSEGATNVSAAVEPVLLDALSQLLKPASK